MKVLPVELHVHIFGLACTDDGWTIRALSMVSRYFWEVSRAYLYQNVSVSGTDRVFALLDRLETLPPRLRQIRHLFLTDVPSTSPKIAAPQLSQQENQAVIRLISLAAPTLHSFSFVPSAPFSSTSLIARVFRTSFPLLKSLTISGFYPFPSSPGKFPSLKHLNLNGNRNPHGLFQMGTLEDACPVLESLEVTGLGLAGGFVLELEDALTASEVWERDDERCGDIMPPAKLPPSVRRVTVQAGPEPVVAANSSGPMPDVATMKDRVLTGRLQALKSRKATRVNGVEVLVLDRCVSPISAEDIRRDWLLALA